jgi:hypothetical protein
MVKLFASGYDAAAVFCLITLGLWSINILVSIPLFKMAYTVYKTGGGQAAAQKDMALMRTAASVASRAPNNV